MEGIKIIRKASHAGSWYTDDKDILMIEIQTFLSKAKKYFSDGSTNTSENLKSLIVPHAGYRWSGPTAAWGYVNINPELYKRVVLIGPSHHYPMEGCGLTKCTEYETPLGNISIDTDSIKKLSQIKGFEMLELDVDEAEHSLEMQLPFLRYIFKDYDIKLLPIMVGQTNLAIEKYFSQALTEFFKDPETLFVISSDFCHWGVRFRFTYHNKNKNYPYESIEYLDRLGMDYIESLSPDDFNKYLSEYKNTICGRRPISILLSTIQESGDGLKNKIKFVKYDQSDKVKDFNGSSVSYAVGLNII